MKNLLLFIFITFIFNGCSLITHKYDKKRVFVGSYDTKNLPVNIRIGTFQYIPEIEMEQNEFLLIGVFSNENRKMDTNISEIVENEIRRFSIKYLLNDNNNECVLRGIMNNLSWNGINGDTTSTINYELKNKDVIINKTEITYIWSQGLFTIRTIPQKLSFTIHGNFNRLLTNSNFITTLNKNCK